MFQRSARQQPGEPVIESPSGMIRTGAAGAAGAAAEAGLMANGVSARINAIMAAAASTGILSMDRHLNGNHTARNGKVNEIMCISHASHPQMAVLVKVSILGPR